MPAREPLLRAPQQRAADGGVVEEAGDHQPARGDRFGELRRELPGVTEKVLAAQLRELELDGIVHREAHDEVPPRVEYSLTPLGVSLNEALSPLGAWGRKNILTRASGSGAAGAPQDERFHSAQALERTRTEA